MLRIPACESLFVGSMGRRGGETEESGEGRCLGYRPVSLCVSDLWEEGGRDRGIRRGERLRIPACESLCVGSMGRRGERQRNQERGEA